MSTILFTQDDTLLPGVKRDLKLLRISPKVYRFLRSVYSRVILIANRLKITDKPACLSIEDYFYFYPLMIEK
jgi:hypothetical protein